MQTERVRLRALIPLYLVAVAALTGLIWQLGHRQALNQLSQRGLSDLAVASDSLSSQLQRYREIAVLVADNLALRHLHTARGIEDARGQLLEASDKSAALDIVFADRSGQVIVAASDPEGGQARKGRVDGPDFKRAMQGALGVDHGHLGAGRHRVWFFSAPVFADDGRVLGAVRLLVDIEELEEDWRGGPAPVYFVDETGEVFITNRSELLGWRVNANGPGLVPPGQTSSELIENRIGPHEIWRLNWSPYVPRRSLHLVQNLPVIGLDANILLDAQPARRLAGAQALAVLAICLALGAMLFLAVERRRALALANAQLETRVAARTYALSQANKRLRREIAEREEAEAALKKAQADLVQAGKLSALGQMSAGISHELNQPLMAIQSFAENAEQFLERGRTDKAAGNLERISGLARRMARIIRNLRAFSRQESAPADRVDLVAVMSASLELLEARVKADGAEILLTAPSHPVWVRGGEVRLSQVFVNLLTNALDAMQGQGRPRIEIAIDVADAPVVTIRDHGPGIDVPDKVFEPFYSTKAVGSAEGLGLGLSISYGIVQSFGGAIEGRNHSDGGAEFTVRLEPWTEEEAA